MNINTYLDSTYLKTASQAAVSEIENTAINKKYIQEAIDCNFKLIMIRPEYVSMAHSMILESKSTVLIGTVVDFPTGKNALYFKLNQAKKAIEDGANELDFVVNYHAFKKGDIELVKNEVITCTQLVLENNKVAKWIIEVAALYDPQIIGLSSLIKNCVLSNFKENQHSKVFVKSSTGFYKTQNKLPNGPSIHSIQLMLENAFPLSVKAAGGIRNHQEALEMIKLGVKRIGTSAAKLISQGSASHHDY